jgi:hypothetical protein
MSSSQIRRRWNDFAGALGTCFGNFAAAVSIGYQQSTVRWQRSCCGIWPRQSVVVFRSPIWTNQSWRDSWFGVAEGEA